METHENEAGYLRHFSDDIIVSELRDLTNSKGNFWFKPHAFELFLALGSALLTIFLINKGTESDWSVIVFILALIVPVFLFGYGISMTVYYFFLSKRMYGLYKKEALRRNLI